ncbi:tetratricopeptide repeat protein [Saccharothrix sp. NRRL B-16348]|uniref:tetratricopeptide repeat protein n=1 Tax=Saccharothrix sp. NRRL B-16348 TaxID=1415542 RepID=UPI000AB5EB16|nr:tetratricopeptide repeat protein [Saccharothrix sp. NRRL B-16348]
MDGLEVRQAAVASGSADVLQAGRDLHVHQRPAVSGPGRGSAAVPSGQLDHQVRGRVDLLAELGSRVRAGGHVVVLHGAGGYGKTTLALAEQVRDEVVIWWVDATGAAAISEGLREVALRAGANAEAVRAAWSGEMSAPDLLWRELDRTPWPWLLVLDNADDPEVLGSAAAGRGWLRHPGPGRTVLITSRDGGAATWGRRAALLPVRQLADDDGAAVLLDLAPDAGTDAEARALAGQLGGLPLALRLAGTYLESTARSPALPGLSVPRGFREYSAALAARFVESTEAVSAGSRHERQVLSRTWELSLDLLAERGHPFARPLLRFLSTLAAAPVPYALLDAARLAESPVFGGLTPQRLADTLGALLGMGLADQNPGAVVLHPLLREINRHQADALDHAAQYRSARLSVLDGATGGLDPADPAGWPRWHMLLPHCAAEHEHDELGARVHRRAALYCEAAGRYGLCEDLYQRVHRVNSRVFGADHPVTLESHHHVADALRIRRALADAEREYRHVLAARTEVLGAGHPDTLATRHDLARVLHQRGDTRTALAEYREVLAGWEESLGPDHHQALRTRHRVAGTLRALGMLDEALAEYRVVLDARTSALGPEHRDTLDTRYDAAGVHLDHGDFDFALAEYEAVFETRRRLFGTEHPVTLSAAHNVVYTIWKRGDLPLAESAHRELLAVRTRVQGSEHNGALITRANLAGVLHDLGRHPEAEAELREVLAIRKRVLDVDHPSTLITGRLLARLLIRTGRIAEADSMCRYLVPAAVRVYGPEHPRTLRVRATFADALLAGGRRAEAEAEYRDVLAIARERFSAGHPVITDVGAALAKMG